MLGITQNIATPHSLHPDSEQVYLLEPALRTDPKSATDLPCDRNTLDMDSRIEAKHNIMLQMENK